MYQVKKSKARRAALRSARPLEPVASSLPGSSQGIPNKVRHTRNLEAPLTEQESRVIDRYELQSELVQSLRQTKRYHHLVHRVAACHRSFRHKVCQHRHEWAQATKRCNVRLCPHDQRTRSLRLAHRWEQVLGDRENLRYVVFAERNSADLSEGLAALYRAWSRLRVSTLWKAAARGSVAVLEVTYNTTNNTWHPHLNVLFEGSYIAFAALKQEWLTATGGNGQTAFIRAADAGTIRELLKYVTKLSDFVGLPEAVDGFLRATARRRFIRTYGCFYRLRIEEEDMSERCPDCDSDCIADIGSLHADQVVIDGDGVLRIDRSRLRNSQQPATEDIDLAWPRAPVERFTKDAAWDAMVEQIEAQEKMLHA